LMAVAGGLLPFARRMRCYLDADAVTSGLYLTANTRSSFPP
jgi:hypothetical protein